NSALMIHNQLTHEKGKESVHLDGQLQNIREMSGRNKEKIHKVDTTGKYQKPVRIEQTQSSQTEAEKNIRTGQTTRIENTEEPPSTFRGFETMGYQHFVKKIGLPDDDHAAFGERTATAERFRDRESSVPDNYWRYRRGHAVYHWHPPAPSFRNVRRLH
ncbi:unnamed protein product, partial [Didymodactylos carnosus]